MYAIRATPNTRTYTKQQRADVQVTKEAKERNVSTIANTIARAMFSFNDNTDRSSHIILSKQGARVSDSQRTKDPTLVPTIFNRVT